MVGDLSLLDEEESFILSGSPNSRIVFLRMPRQAVLSRYPCLLRNTAVTLDMSSPASSFVRAALINLISAVPHLTNRQRGSALAAFVQVLGVLEADPERQVSSWRDKEALEFIELNFCNPELQATDVAKAQRISRRRLDAILVQSTGFSITAHIWNRRLEQAAQDLRDPLRAHWSASQVGYVNGFSHPAHFSRVFKERYGASPLQFRLGGEQADTALKA